MRLATLALCVIFGLPSLALATGPDAVPGTSPSEVPTDGARGEDLATAATMAQEAQRLEAEADLPGVSPAQRRKLQILARAQREKSYEVLLRIWRQGHDLDALYGAAITVLTVLDRPMEGANAALRFLVEVQRDGRKLDKRSQDRLDTMLKELGEALARTRAAKPDPEGDARCDGLAGLREGELLIAGLSESDASLLFRDERIEGRPTDTIFFTRCPTAKLVAAPPPAASDSGPFALMAVGGVVGATAVGLYAASAETRGEREGLSLANANAHDTQVILTSKREEDAYKTAALVVGGVGAAALLGGLIWWAARDDAPSIRPSMTVGPTSATFTLPF